MGKKKSVMLMVLLTIVIIALSVVTLFPPVSFGVKDWNPVTLQFDLGADLGGGYYAYYYPEGVISETDYKADLPEVEEGNAESQKAYDEYVESYLQHGSLYLETDPDKGLVEEDGTISQSFSESFEKTANEIVARFAKKQYSDYRVSIVDDYAIRVELPASAYDSENTAVDGVASTLTMFGNLGAVELQKSGQPIDEMKKGAKASDLIESVSVKTKYKTAYLSIEFTSEGKDMLENEQESLSPAPTSSAADTSSLVSIDVMIGGEKLVSIYSDSIMDDKEVRIMPTDTVYADYLETVEILLDSALEIEVDEYDVALTTSALRSFEPVYGENVLTYLYIALGVILLALLVLPVCRTGRFGGVSVYGNLSYLIITAMCFAFINRGVFEITLGSVLVFLGGLVLMNVLQAMIYRAIKTEFMLGKTVESSVKGGYKKTLWGIVDIYVVLALAAIAFLFGAPSLHTLGLQALICVAAAAFGNLLWNRAINYTFLSASKNKYKYFRFVREDDDDDE